MNERRAAALIVFAVFAIWGIIEGALGHSVFDQIVFAFIFGIISIVIKVEGNKSIFDLFKRKEDGTNTES